MFVNEGSHMQYSNHTLNIAYHHHHVHHYHNNSSSSRNESPMQIQIDDDTESSTSALRYINNSTAYPANQSYSSKFNDHYSSAGLYRRQDESHYNESPELDNGRFFLDTRLYSIKDECEQPEGEDATGSNHSELENNYDSSPRMGSQSNGLFAGSWSVFMPRIRIFFVIAKNQVRILEENLAINLYMY